MWNHFTVLLAVLTLSNHQGSHVTAEENYNLTSKEQEYPSTALNNSGSALKPWKSSVNDDNISATLEPGTQTGAELVKLVFLAQFCLDDERNISKEALLNEVMRVRVAENLIQQINSMEQRTKFVLEIQDVCTDERKTLQAILSESESLHYDETTRPSLSARNSLGGFFGGLRDLNPIVLEGALHGTDIPIVSTDYRGQLPPMATFNYSNYFSARRTDESEIEEIVKLLQEVDWSYVVLVSTDDQYGIKSSNYAKKLIKEAGICIAKEIQLSVSDRNPQRYDEAVYEIRQSEASGVLYLGDHQQLLWIVELYTRRTGLVGRNKTILVSSNVKISDELKRQVHNQPDHLNLSLVAVSRLGSKSLNDSVRANLYSSLGVSDDPINSDQFEKPEWYKTIQTNTGYTYTAEDFDLVPDDIFKRTESVVRLLASSQLNKDISILRSMTMSKYPDHDFDYDLFVAPSLVFTNQHIPLLCHSYAYPTDFAFTINMISKASNHHKEDRTPLTSKQCSNGGLASRTPSVGRSRCIINCQKCDIVKAEERGYIFVPGKDSRVVLGSGALHSTNDLRRCSTEVTVGGYLEMRAFQMGHSFFQERSGLNYSTLYMDNCASDRKMKEVLNRVFRKDRAEIVDIWGKNHSIPIHKFLLIIGDASSSVTNVLLNHFKHDEIPQIASTSSSGWFDDVTRYPQLLRLTESNKELVRVMLQTCQQLNVTAIVLLYSDTEYGRSAASLFQSSAHNSGICVQQSIILRQNVTLITDVGQKLAIETNYPRVFVLFAEDSIVKVLTTAIASRDIHWTNEGRILLTESDLQRLLDCKTVKKFLGSLRIAIHHSPKLSIPGWSPENMYTFDMSQAIYNKWYAHFWQQNRGCFITDQAEMPTSFSLTYKRECQYQDFSFWKDSECETNTWFRVSQHLNHSDITEQKMKYLSWVALTYALSDTPRHSKMAVLNNKTLLMQRLLHTNLSLFDPSTHQGYVSYSVLNLHKFNNKNAEKYDEVYRTHRSSDQSLTFVKTHDPIFYRYGEVDSKLQSQCSPALCPCIELNHGPLDGQIQDGTQPPLAPTDKSKTTTTLMAVSIVLLVGVCIVEAGLLIRLLEKKEKSKPVEDGYRRGGVEINYYGPETHEFKSAPGQAVPLIAAGTSRHMADDSAGPTGSSDQNQRALTAAQTNDSDDEYDPVLQICIDHDGNTQEDDDPDQDYQPLSALQAASAIVLSTIQIELQTSEADSSPTGQNLYGDPPVPAPRRVIEVDTKLGGEETSYLNLEENEKKRKEDREYHSDTEDSNEHRMNERGSNDSSDRPISPALNAQSVEGDHPVPAPRRVIEVDTELGGEETNYLNLEENEKMREEDREYHSDTEDSNEHQMNERGSNDSSDRPISPALNGQSVEGAITNQQQHVVEELKTTEQEISGNPSTNGHVSDVRNNMSHPVQCNSDLIPSISPVSSRDESSLDTSASLSTRRQSSAQVESNIHPVNESEHHQVLGSTHSSYTLQFSLSGSQTLSSPSSQW